jgi:hypothetical protein
VSDDPLVEHYAPSRWAEASLAQRLHDEGLIYAINRLVLHPVGLALGVDVTNLDRETMRGEVQQLFLLSTHGERIVYQDDAEERCIAKLREAGHDAVARWLEVLMPEPIDALDMAAALDRANTQHES